jgi:phage antirepressor YoqD-like protein
MGTTMNGNTPAVLGRPPLMMTSLEIAELVEVRHDSVRRSIEMIAERGGLILPQIVEVSTDAVKGPRSVRVYILNERDTMVVVAQLSPEFLGRVIDRWRWLEAQFVKAAPVAVDMNDPELLRELLLTYTGRVIELQKDVGHLERTVQVMTPQVEALHRIALEPADDAPVSLRAAAKNCCVPPLWLVNWMIANKWLYRGAGEPPGDLIPYQPKVTAGYLELKIVEQVRTSKTNSNVQVVRRFLQPVVTQKGRARLAVELEKCVGVPNTSIPKPKRSRSLRP